MLAMATGRPLWGQTAIIAPSGEVVARSSTLGDELVVYRCDVDLVKPYKERLFDFARHRRIEHYQLIATQTGAVTVSMPQNYSAHVQAETGMGGIQSDFPVPVDPSNGRSHRVDFNVGSGGSLIHVATGNGGVRFKRAETQ